jgi:hypothetical protein
MGRTCAHTRTLICVKSFTAIDEACSIAYFDRDIRNKIIHGLTTLHSLMKCLKKSGCLSSSRWWTFLASAVKVFWKFFVATKK